MVSFSILASGRCQVLALIFFTFPAGRFSSLLTVLISEHTWGCLSQSLDSLIGTTSLWHGPVPLARTGVSPLAKRPLSDATNPSQAVAQNRIQPVKPSQVHLTTRSRVAHHELFRFATSTSLPMSPTKSGAFYSPSTSMGQFTLSSRDTFQQKVSITTCQSCTM